MTNANTVNDTAASTSAKSSKTEETVIREETVTTEETTKGPLGRFFSNKWVKAGAGIAVLGGATVYLARHVIATGEAEVPAEAEAAFSVAIGLFE